jgi:hypothetical protein
MTMSDTGSRPPLNPERPAPPGDDTEVSDIEVETPVDEVAPDSTGVSATAGTEEAPD